MPATDHVTETITTIDELREVLAPPSHFVTDKEFTELDDLCTDFIGRSPFVLVASADGEGRVDISPKGDAPGFVRVLDARTLAIPERLGNHRADTFTNIVAQPWVGLIFMIPGTRNTLRLRGRASIARDQWLRDDFAVDGKVPELSLVVDITSGYFHCAKCIVRSQLWATAGAPDDENLLARAMVRHGDLPVTVDEMQEIILDDQATRLY